MNYYSLNRQAPDTHFKEAVIRGLAPDKGLYFPESITPLPSSFWNNLKSYDDHEIAFRAISQFVDDVIPEKALREIINETLSFDFPVVQLTNNIATLELFHGPTMAFKDVGARFMARCLGYFSSDLSEEVTVLVATSGDTGGAVANGFLGVEGVKVVILYPKGKVSDIQERQLTTLGQNITALRVDGVFDDCQDMVKTAFLDESLISKMQLTSANSINVARWLPQMLYFIFAYKQVYETQNEIVFSVPSGNFGNICAGMMAQQLGMPVKHFIASNNANNTVTEFLNTGEYCPKSSVQTISNAMDVGNPSNFIRIKEIYANEFEKIKEHLLSFSFTDEETKKAMDQIFHEHGYIADPHGAVGYLGAKTYLESHPDAYCIFLETAHPTKFLDVVEEVIDQNVELPEQIKGLMDKHKTFKDISSYDELRNFLLDNKS